MFLRTGQGYALVIDSDMHFVGAVTLARLFSMIFDVIPDDFCEDSDIWSVANRKL
jgi:CBS domain containing-hemolysin-like protein